MRKNWTIHLVCALLIGGAFVFGRSTAKTKPVERVITQIDTICHTDTIIAYKPLYLREYVRDTMRVRDTVYVTLPRQVREYRDSTYYARVSGYRPELEYIETYNRTQIIHERETIPAPEPGRWSLAVTAGYGAGKDGLTPFVGVGVSWSIFLFK